MRQSEFVADEESDWAFHCHKSHHTMNAMSQDVANLIGVDLGEVARKITNLIPDYMVMGERGMADMAAMEIPIPDNTAPMMTGDDPYGSVEMGGIFSVVKVRRNQRPRNYSDPGWYQHPPGTLAYQFTGTPGKPARLQSDMRPAMPRLHTPPAEVAVTVRKLKKYTSLTLTLKREEYEN